MSSLLSHKVTMSLFIFSRTANILAGACEVERGDRVMVILPRVPEWWLVNIGCLRTGNRVRLAKTSSSPLSLGFVILMQASQSSVRIKMATGTFTHNS